MSDDEGRDQGTAPEARGPLGGRPARFWVITGLVVLGFVLVLQNSLTAAVHVLWFTIRMPLVFLLVAMVLVGIALDRAWLWRQRRR